MLMPPGRPEADHWASAPPDSALPTEESSTGWPTISPAGVTLPMVSAPSTTTPIVVVGTWAPLASWPEMVTATQPQPGPPPPSERLGGPDRAVAAVGVPVRVPSLPMVRPAGRVGALIV